MSNILKWYSIILSVFLFGMWARNIEDNILNYLMVGIGGAIMMLVAHKIAEMEDYL